MRMRELWVKGFSGREETDRHINILFPVKVFRRKKGKRKKWDIYRSHPMLLFPIASS